MYHRTMVCLLALGDPVLALPLRDQRACIRLGSDWGLQYLPLQAEAASLYCGRGRSNRRDRADRSNRGARNVPGRPWLAWNVAQARVSGSCFSALAPLNQRLDVLQAESDP